MVWRRVLLRYCNWAGRGVTLQRLFFLYIPLFDALFPTSCSPSPTMDAPLMQGLLCLVIGPAWDVIHGAHASKGMGTARDIISRIWLSVYVAAVVLTSALPFPPWTPVEITITAKPVRVLVPENTTYLLPPAESPDASLVEIAEGTADVGPNGSPAQGHQTARAELGRRPPLLLCSGRKVKDGTPCGRKKRCRAAVYLCKDHISQGTSRNPSVRDAVTGNLRDLRGKNTANGT